VLKLAVMMDDAEADAVIQEAYVQGISTRSVDDLVKALGMTGISKSQVSRLCGEIDDKVHTFLNRPLEGEWPYIWLDATYLKVWQNGRIVSVAVIVAVGVNGDGRHEVLGLAIGPRRPSGPTSCVSWPAGACTASSSSSRMPMRALKAAIAKVLHASWQRCRVHFMRNVLAHAGKQGRRVVAAFIATAFAQDDAEAARTQWRLHELPGGAPAQAAIDKLRQAPSSSGCYIRPARATSWRGAARRLQAPPSCLNQAPPA
jgi:transposase-like protein